MYENKPVNCKNIKVTCKLTEQGLEENKNNLSNLIIEQVSTLKKDSRLNINSLFILKKQDSINIYWVLEDSNVIKRKNDLLKRLSFDPVLKILNIENCNRDSLLKNLKDDLNTNWKIYDIPK